MLTDIKEVIEKLDKELLDVPLDFIGMEKGSRGYRSSNQYIIKGEMNEQ